MSSSQILVYREEPSEVLVETVVTLSQLLKVVPMTVLVLMRAYAGCILRSLSWIVCEGICIRVCVCLCTHGHL